MVAPVRERGLKSNIIRKPTKTQSRSREGAWIEIMVMNKSTLQALRRSREGAWIEMGVHKLTVGEAMGSLP